VLCALVLHHEDDPTCWRIDDQYYLGDAFLVAPIMNPEGVRDVYLPAGEWVDFWSGEALSGPRWLRRVEVPLARMPLYVRCGAQVSVYPEPVQCTDEMDLSRAAMLAFDEGYAGFRNSILGAYVGL
jgi:alpha-D-xyloside xylohydrolase